VSWITILAGMTGIGAVINSAALSYSVDLQEVYSGTKPSSQTSPWLRATFEDIAGGKVRLTMDALNLSSGEFVGTWSFNINPSVAAASLNFDLSTLDPAQVVPNSIGHTPTGQNYKAGPEKYFDIQFANQTANNPGRFTAGESLIYEIGLIGGTLSAADFLYVNQQKNGSLTIPDDWYSAAHIQGIVGGKSGWIGARTYYQNEEPTHAVPDRGQTALLLAGASLGLCAFGYYRKREIPIPTSRK
jgi:hypothetical protein